MKRLAVAIQVFSAFVILFVFLDPGIAKQPIEVPLQYGQFCDVQKIAGKGITDISTSISDDEIALGYSNTMTGNGDIEIDQVNEYSQNNEKTLRRIDVLNDTNESSLNLFDNIKLSYSGSTPLVGKKSISSSVGARIRENFAVYEIEKEQTAFASSTGSRSKSDHLLYHNPVHTMGLDTKNTFNGTWGTDSKWHKKFSKDIKANDKFSGKFEIEKLIMFHTSPV